MNEGLGLIYSEGSRDLANHLLTRVNVTCGLRLVTRWRLGLDAFRGSASRKPVLPCEIWNNGCWPPHDRVKTHPTSSIHPCVIVTMAISMFLCRWPHHVIIDNLGPRRCQWNFPGFTTWALLSMIGRPDAVGKIIKKFNLNGLML